MSEENPIDAVETRERWLALRCVAYFLLGAWVIVNIDGIPLPFLQIAGLIFLAREQSNERIKQLCYAVGLVVFFVGLFV